MRRPARPQVRARARSAAEMLYYLLYHVLQRYFSPLNVFRYITVRTAYASLTALFLCLVLGPWVVRRLREMQIGQFIREEGPERHQSKAGTPTMGGVEPRDSRWFTASQRPRRRPISFK